MRFDLVTLRLFVAVAELRSLSKAAQREGIAVSALSKRITDLERDLGTALLVRLPRGVAVTAAGTALLHHTTVVLDSLRRFEGDIGEYARGVKGHVRMLVNESALIGGLPEELGEFVRRYPDIKIDLRGENSGPILRAVADGAAEVGIFTAGRAVPPGVRTIPYRTDRLALIVPSGHPLSTRGSVRFEEVVTEDFVGLGVGSAWDELVAEAGRTRRMQPRIRFRLASFDAVCRLIGAGLGVGLAPPAVARCLHQCQQPPRGPARRCLGRPGADAVRPRCARPGGECPADGRAPRGPAVTAGSGRFRLARNGASQDEPCCPPVLPLSPGQGGRCARPLLGARRRADTGGGNDGQFSCGTAWRRTARARRDPRSPPRATPPWRPAGSSPAWTACRRPARSGRW